MAYLLPDAAEIACGVITNVNVHGEGGWRAVVADGATITETGLDDTALFLGRCAPDENARWMIDCLALLPFVSEGAVTRNLTRRMEHSSSSVYSFAGLPEAIVGVPNSTLIAMNPDRLVAGMCA